MRERGARTKRPPIALGLLTWLRTTHRAAQRGRAARASSRRERESATAFESRRRRAAQPLQREDHRPGQRERNRDDEEEEAGGERRIGADVQLPEEADEERLADSQPVDRE